MTAMTAGRAGNVLLVVLCGLCVLAALLLLGQVLVPVPIRLPGITIDRLSALMALLVALVGATTYRFALRYLAGEVNQRVFLNWLAFTIIAALLLMLATHLLVLFVAWMLTSIGLHQLLTHYHDRREAVAPARKKFLISRLGDLILVAAISLIWARYDTLDIYTFFARVAETGTTPTSIAVLVALAALMKSAQFPFHSWLPETMEAPTPVSALMHAGIINAGGVLLLRFAPLIVAAPWALLLLAVIGTITMALGMLAMWAQTDIKRTLAWSTVSQMGFMMVQCGLAVFPAAALHIVGHGCYKAWSFLRSGELPAGRGYVPQLPPAQALGWGLAGTLVAVPTLAQAALLTGFNPLHSPGELALTAIVALSIGQLWVAVARAGGKFASRLLFSLGLTLALSVGALWLYHGAALFFAPALGQIPAPTGPLAWVAATLPVMVLAALAVLHALLPTIERSAAGRALHVHALHGFYLGMIANRIVERVWATFPSTRATNV